MDRPELEKVQAALLAMSESVRSSATFSGIIDRGQPERRWLVECQGDSLSRERLEALLSRAGRALGGRSDASPYDCLVEWGEHLRDNHARHISPMGEGPDAFRIEVFPRVADVSSSAIDRLLASIAPRAPEHDDELVSHSDDFRSVVWYGQKYTFTQTQAACVRVLWEHWKRRTPAVSDAATLEAADSNSRRLADVFRERQGGHHPAWGTMIRQARRGSHQLAEPVKTGVA